MIYKYNRKESKDLFIYWCKKHTAVIMRKNGFKFRPVCKDASLENLTRCDYVMEIDIIESHLKIEIVL